jgi:hypothetical protein
MAGPNLTIHIPIIECINKANTTPYSNAIAEAAGQTFAFGTPVQLSAGGYVQAWDGTTVTAGILGVSESFGLNLGSAGLGQPIYPFGQVTGSIATQTYGTVPNQSGGVNVALGTPVSEGRTLYVEPNQDNIFEAMFDNAAGNVAADWTPVQSDIGKSYGMTKDSAGPYWYVDKNKTGGSALVQIVGIHPTDGFALNARVRFQFLTASIQVI